MDAYEKFDVIDFLAIGFLNAEQFNFESISIFV
jgi:hypothetical protein